MFPAIILFLSLIGGYFFVTSKTGQDSLNTIATNISDAALNLVAKFEGFSSTVYKDIAGYLTIGYGHKIQPGEDIPNQITENQAKQLLQQDMQQAANVVNKYVSVPLNENQFNALVSFVYNTSSNDESVFANSHLLSKLNSGDYEGAATEFDKWIYAGGQKSAGLIARREQEKDLFLT